MECAPDTRRSSPNARTERRRRPSASESATAAAPAAFGPVILFGYSPSRPKDYIGKHDTCGRCQANDPEQRRETTERGQGFCCGKDSGDDCSCKAYQDDTQETA